MNKQILLVEDDAAIMDTLTIFLRYEGFEVRQARSVERALAVLEDFRPELVLLDYMLLDDTAEKVVAVARERHRGVPILLLTAADDPTGKALALEVDGVVAKPFELELLLKSVLDLLGSGGGRRFRADLGQQIL